MRDLQTEIEKRLISMDINPSTFAIHIYKDLIVALASNPKICLNVNPDNDISELNLMGNANEVVQQAEQWCATGHQCDGDNLKCEYSIETIYVD